MMDVTSGTVAGQSRVGDVAASMSLDSPLLRPDQVAVLLSVRRSWVYDAVKNGKLPCLRVGRHIRFTRPMIEAWLAQQSGATD